MRLRRHPGAIVVPEDLWNTIIDRLLEPETPPLHRDRQRRLNYLADRCTPSFLERFIERQADILDSVSEPGLMLEAVPEANLAIKLHQSGLLPEPFRERFRRDGFPCQSITETMAPPDAGDSPTSVPVKERVAQTP